MSGEAPKPGDKYDLTEDELLEVLKFAKSWKAKLLKHPESPDFIKLQELEQHCTRRVEVIVTKRYWAEKAV